MGSAAQPRSGTAPNAPAASAVFRNLRRLWLAMTDCLLSFFISLPLAPIGLTRLLSYIWRRIPCHTQSARRTKVRTPCDRKRRAPQHEQFHASIATVSRKAADLAERWAAFRYCTRDGLFGAADQPDARL